MYNSIEIIYYNILKKKVQLIKGFVVTFYIEKK